MRSYINVSTSLTRPLQNRLIARTLPRELLHKLSLVFVSLLMRCRTGESKVARLVGFNTTYDVENSRRNSNGKKSQFMDLFFRRAASVFLSKDNVAVNHRAM